jgi:type III pantothenate kinase
VELVAPATAIGRSTVTALQSGIVLGTAAMVDGLIDRVADELGGNPKVVATGGLAPVVADHCRRIDLVEPILTLMGLRLIFERNAT